MPPPPGPPPPQAPTPGPPPPGPPHARAADAAWTAARAAAEPPPPPPPAAAAAADWAANAAAAADWAAAAAARADARAAAASDLDRLIALNPGEPDALGAPIDPSEAGPLGPLWPQGVPEWYTEAATGTVTPHEEPIRRRRLTPLPAPPRGPSDRVEGATRAS